MLSRTPKPTVAALAQTCQGAAHTVARRSLSTAAVRNNKAPTVTKPSEAKVPASKSVFGSKLTLPSSSPILDMAMPLAFPTKTLREFPSLLEFADPILDPHPSQVHHSPPTKDIPYPSTTIFYNDPKHFKPTPPSASSLIMSTSSSTSDEVNSSDYLSSVTPLSAVDVSKLYKHTLASRRVTQMTGKGKNQSMYTLVVAGNGNGLVGYGEGKDIEASKSIRKAFHAAVKSLDHVNIHKGNDGSRTVESQCEAKWGASRVVLRPRPAGFGLRVPPAIHSICRAIGITDLSAAIYGSTNPTNVVKATFQILSGGAAPIGLGDGIGGPMRKKDKGHGMRDRVEIERSRGRQIRQV